MSRRGLARLGCADVETYIQSGNAVFRADRGADDLAESIGAGIAAEFGFRPAVLLREAGQLAVAVAANPFAQDVQAPKSPHFFFLAAPARGADLATLAALVAPGEAFHLTDTVFYLHAPGGIGRSALAARAERLLGVPVTARNLRTVSALDQMARRLAATGA